MISQDNQQYITVDVFNARMDRLEAVMERNLAGMREDNAKFREQMKDDFNAFRQDVCIEIDTLKKEVRTDIIGLRQEASMKIDELHAEMVTLQKDVEGLKHDVTGLYHWDYWLLSIILVLFAMPQIVAGVRSLFGAVTDGIAGIIALFRKD